MRRIFLLPLALFLVLAAFLAVGLQRDPREVPSPLVGRPAPDFTLPRLGADAQAEGFAPRQMLGQVWLLNVWASWCVSCRQEHPVWLAFAKSAAAPVVGLDYKDGPAEARSWLARFGDPYRLSVVDADGRVGIDYGVYGVPETYLIDKAGVVRLKHTGPVTAELMRERILPLIRDLQQ